MKNMKKAIILIVILTVILTCTLVACNKNDSHPNTVSASFELDANDGIDNFTIRRGVVFQHKLAELKKINGIEAELNYDNKNNIVNLSVTNAKQASLSDILAAIGSEPKLSFKSSRNADAQALFYGKENIKSISTSVDSISNPSIKIEFTQQGIEKVNANLGRHLYVYVDNEFVMEVVSNLTLSSGNAVLTVSPNQNALEAETSVAKMNACVFSLNIKNLNIEYIG